MGFIDWLKRGFAAKKETKIAETKIENVSPVDLPPAPVAIPAKPIDIGSLAWYENLLKTAKLSDNEDERARVAWALRCITPNISRYKKIESMTGVPWPLIAAIHGLEASFKFDRYLGNGDRLDRKTVNVPSGRGPFASFEDGAIDALKYDGLTDVRDWTLEKMLQMAERYNGTGYLSMYKKGRLFFSPYIWSCTNVYPGRGKYVRDHVFDPDAKDDQVGVAAVLLKLQELGLMTTVANVVA
jgi:lysozyme family protein